MNPRVSTPSAPMAIAVRDTTCVHLNPPPPPLLGSASSLAGETDAAGGATGEAGAGAGAGCGARLNASSISSALRPFFSRNCLFCASGLDVTCEDGGG